MLYDISVEVEPLTKGIFGSKHDHVLANEKSLISKFNLSHYMDK